MVKTTPELKRIIKRYRLQLEKLGIRPARILLYGSQATGTAQEGSDVDLIVISDDWKKYNHRQRLELLGIAAARILEPVQAQGFTPTGYLIAGNRVIDQHLDGMLIKTDSAGNLQWSRTFGGDQNDWFGMMKQGPNNEIIIMGWTDSFGEGAHNTWLLGIDPTTLK